MMIYVSPINLIGLSIIVGIFVVGYRKVGPLIRTSRRLELKSRAPLLTSINDIMKGILSLRSYDL